MKYYAIQNNNTVTNEINLVEWENLKDYLLEECDISILSTSNQTFDVLTHQYEQIQEDFDHILSAYDVEEWEDNYNDEQKMHINTLLDDNKEDELFLYLYNLKTGKTYHRRYLRGFCQGDIVECIYPEESEVMLDYVEIVIFNTGTSYTIYYTDETITDPNDLDENDACERVYIDGWQTDKQLKDMYGDDIIIYDIDDCYTITHYSYKRA